MKAVGTTNQYVYTGRAGITTEGYNGRQAWSFSGIATATDLAVIGGNLAGRQSGSQIPPARYLLQNCKHNVKISNVGQGTVKLTVIHVRSKRDVYANMNYYSPNLQLYEWQGNPLSAIQQGIAASAAGPLLGDLNYLIPGVDETESPIFNQFYTVVKRTEILLSVGGTHKLSTNVYYDRVVDATVYGNTAMSDLMGITDYLVYKAEGQTGIKDEGDGPIPTIAPCQVAYTENWDYSFIQVANSKRFLNVSDEVESTATMVNVISASTGSGVSASGLIT